ncbi:MAG: VWA domain-containing protein [Myxococcales bacterium]|nr:VWA domain-containing protein [Myxococcales bacterium]
MSFSETHWLMYGLLATLGVAGLMLWGARRRARDLARLVAPRLRAALTPSLSPGRRALRAALLLVAVASIAIALARPRLGFDVSTVERKGLDLLIALDTSRSMQAPDPAPDRLTRAKLAVHDLVERFPRDRVGLLTFAGGASLECPLTFDRAIFTDTLQAVTVGAAPGGGTHLAAVIDAAREAARSERQRTKLLVMLTDGEDLQGDALVAARRAADEGLRIFTVGIGSPEGALIPTAGGFVRDAQGEAVRSTLDAQTLQAVAAATDGAYQPLGADGLGLTRLYQTQLAGLNPETLDQRTHRVPIERFQWPLGLALLCLFAEALLGERRRRRRTLPAVTATLLMLPLAAQADPGSAWDAWVRGDLAAAAEGYRAAAEADPSDPVLSLNAATTAVQAGDYEAAVEAAERVLAHPDPAHHARAWYAIGSARFRQGHAALGTDRASTRARWLEARDAFGTAVDLAPEDEDAAHNLDVITRALAALDEAEAADDADPQSGAQAGDAQEGAGEDGDGQEGEGQDGAGKEGAGKEGAGNEGAGKEGAGEEGDGQEGAGKEGAGKEGAGKEGDGKEGDGKEGDGKEGDGQDGEGQEGAGKEGAGKEGAGKEGAGKTAPARKAPVRGARSGRRRSGRRRQGRRRQGRRAARKAPARRAPGQDGAPARTPPARTPPARTPTPRTPTAGAPTVIRPKTKTRPAGRPPRATAPTPRPRPARAPRKAPTKILPIRPPPARPPRPPPRATARARTATATASPPCPTPSAPRPTRCRPAKPGCCCAACAAASAACPPTTEPRPAPPIPSATGETHGEDPDEERADRPAAARGHGPRRQRAVRAPAVGGRPPRPPHHPPRRRRGAAPADAPRARPRPHARWTLEPHPGDRRRPHRHHRVRLPRGGAAPR